MKRVFAEGALQIEKWKLKIEKSVRWKTTTNWKVKIEKGVRRGNT